MIEDPVATASQHEQEVAALELIEHPTVKAAYRTVAETWLGRAKASDAMRERFDDSFAEVMFSAAVWSSNQDKLRPKVSCITRLAHPVDGRSIPGSRWGIDNPDSVYRVIPISGDGTLRDPRPGRRAPHDGELLHAVGRPHGHRRCAQRPHHGRSTPTAASPSPSTPNPPTDDPTMCGLRLQAHEFYIRDVLLDWGRDDPNHLEVQRLGGPPVAPARTRDEQAEATAAMMAYFADFTGKLSHGVYKMPPNHFNLAWSADKVGAMRNQVYVMGRFDLAPDEAFVVDVSDGGAEYFTVPLSNIWGTTLDIVDRTGSLNKAQSVANEDGTYTYVISPVDPGRGELDRLRRAARRHLDAADGRVRRRRPSRGPRRPRPGRQTGPPRRRSADVASGEPRGAGGRTRRAAGGVPAAPPGRDDLRWRAG